MFFCIFDTLPLLVSFPVAVSSPKLHLQHTSMWYLMVIALFV